MPRSECLESWWLVHSKWFAHSVVTQNRRFWKNSACLTLFWISVDDLYTVSLVTGNSPPRQNSFFAFFSRWENVFSKKNENEHYVDIIIHFLSVSYKPVKYFGRPAGVGDNQSNIRPDCPLFSPSEVTMTPKRMLTGALLLVVAQPSLSSPYVLMMRQASPLLYPASYLSSSHQTLYTGMFSPWSSFYFPSVATQRNAAPAAQQAPATTRQLEAKTATDGTII